MRQTTHFGNTTYLEIINRLCNLTLPPLQETVRVNLEPLQTAMAKIMPVITKSAIPQTSEVLLTLSEGKLELIANNLEKQVEAEITDNIRTFGTGRVAINATLFNDLLAQYPPEGLSMGFLADGLRLSIANHNSLLKGNNGSDFIIKPKIAPAQATISPTELKAMLMAVVRSAEDKAKDYSVFSGVLFQVENDTLTMVACNRVLLSTVSQPTTMPPMTFIAPVKAMLTLIKQLNLFLKSKPSEADMVVISLDEGKKVTFKIGDKVDFSTELIKAEYPNYKKIIQEANDSYRTTFALNTLDFAKSIRLSQSQASQDCRGVSWEATDTVSLTVQNQQLKIASRNANHDPSREFNTAAEGVQAGEDTDPFYFKLPQLQLVLTALADSPVIKLHFGRDPDNPGTISPLRLDGEKSTHYLMPCSL